MKSPVELVDLADYLKTWNFIDVLYFADSLGSMNEEAVKVVYGSLRKHWEGDIGFHAHNNMGRGLENAALAKRLGCTWIDGTVTGMGRGAGNAETEYLLLHPEIGFESYKADKMSSLIEQHFAPLKKEYGWGVSMPYFIGALRGLHPTYIQELVQDETLHAKSIPKIIDDIASTAAPNNYSYENLQNAKASNDLPLKAIGQKEDKNLFIGQEVVLVAQTDQSRLYRDAIKDYAEIKNAFLISINQPKKGIELDYDYVAVSHNQKFREDIEEYGSSGYRYVAPKELFVNEKIEIAYDYGLTIVAEEFDRHGTHATIPFWLTLPYAIGFCLDYGAQNIRLAGFHGYDSQDQRQKEMIECINIMRGKNIDLVSLMPTTLPIKEQSVYSLSEPPALIKDVANLEGHKKNSTNSG